MALFSSISQRVGQLIDVDLVQVSTRRLQLRVAHKALQGEHIAAAFAQEAIREPMPQRMWRQRGDLSPRTNPLHQPPQALRTALLLRVLAAPLPRELRDPHFDLDSENVVIEVGSEFAERITKLNQHIRINREPVPVRTLPLDPDAAADEIDINPATRPDFRAPQSRSFHEQNRWPFESDSGQAECG